MKSILAHSLALVLAAAAVPALAQPAGPPPMEAHGTGMDHGGMDPAAMAQHRAQMLRDVLQLRPNQEPALTELMGAMKPPEGMRERMMAEHHAMMGLSTPQRLDRMHDNMARRQAAFEQRAMAIKRFYAQLTPAQQKAFDALPPMAMRHGMHRMGAPGGHGMGGGMGPGGAD